MAVLGSVRAVGIGRGSAGVHPGHQDQLWQCRGPPGPSGSAVAHQALTAIPTLSLDFPGNGLNAHLGPRTATGARGDLK